MEALGTEMNYCSGCGVCAAACPIKLLDISMSEQGEYRPEFFSSDHKDRCTKCDLCENLCALLSDEKQHEYPENWKSNEGQKLPWREEVGYYGQSFAGHTINTEQRLAGSSGGIATWTMQQLLKRGMVDAVVCVQPQSHAPFFKPVICETVEEIQQCSKSSYYPVEFSEVLEQVIRGPERRYAIIGLPCTITSIRLAMKSDSRLRRRGVYLLSLVCGQQKSSLYTDYLSMLAGHDHEEVKSINFREKSLNSPASNFNFVSTNNDGEEKRLSWFEGPKDAWFDYFFTLDACHFCQDVFGESADIVFMDAWLPQYVKDPKGTTLWIVRHPELGQLFHSNEECEANPIPIQHVINSQKVVVTNKKKNFPYRVYEAKKLGWNIPEEWECRKAPSSLLAMEERHKLIRTRLSKKALKEVLDKGGSLEDYEQAMAKENHILTRLKKARYYQALARRIIQAPFNIINKIKKRL
jgi:coenzyme F420 hydrogenase subunit beta